MLHLVTSCTDGKRVAPVRGLRLSAHHGTTIERRFESWWRALTQPSLGTSPLFAQDLYLGDHWAVILDALALAESHGWHPQLWVLSAGYGLVPASAPLLPYAATFQPRHADSVSRRAGIERAAEHQAWWRLLSQTSGPTPDTPRSITTLVQSTPSATVLLAASPAYLRAIAKDLLEAATAAPERLILITSSTKDLHPDLAARLVPSDARFQPLVHGSMISLHARVARWLIQTSSDHRFEMPEIAAQVDRYLKTATPPPRLQRSQAEDDTVRAFIQKRLRVDKNVTHSGLLREWRSAGRACEQSRFRQLFHQIRGTHA